LVAKHKKILAINVHPNLDGKHTIEDTQPSWANKLIMKTLDQVPQVTTHRLVEKYPNKVFDLAYERKLLVDHDLILMIGPIYWYSLPAIAKQWIDEVLLYGWAYGSDGNALAGKGIQLILTSGSVLTEYAHDEIGNTLEEFFSSYQRSFEYCKMNWLGIKFIGGINNSIKEGNLNAQSQKVISFSNSLISELT